MTARTRHHRRRGSVLIVAMLVTAMLALVLGSYFNLTLTSSRQTRRIFDRNAAFHLAEAGIEEAVWSYNRALARSPDAWAGWNTEGVAAWRKFTDFTLTPGSTGFVKVYASDTTPKEPARPLIVAESTVQTRGAQPISQMIEVTLQRRSFFANGLTARRTLWFKGPNATFDSWSSDPDNDPSTPPVPYGDTSKHDLGGVASTAVESTAVLINNSRIYGFVSTGGAEPDVGKQGLIGPFGTLEGEVISTRVATDFVAHFPNIEAPADTTLITALGNTLGTPGEATRWHTDSINLTGSQSLTILGDVTLVLTARPGRTALKIGGNAQLIIPDGSRLTLYTDGDIAIGGNGLANANIQPASFQIWSTHVEDGGQTIDLMGNGILKAVVYAPNADVTLNGNTHMMGAVVGRDITFTGRAAFHYDSSLSALTAHAPYGPGSWKILSNERAQQTRQSLFNGW